VAYSDLIRERFRRPRFRGELPAPDAVAEDVNPLCGDRIRIECRIADGALADARHRGDSCAICAAAADVLLEMAIGQPLDFAARTRTEDLVARLGAEIRPTRLKCVTLPLDVLRTATGARRAA
jgi:NifU-like protein involved in Fe-S cluster formation